MKLHIDSTDNLKTIITIDHQSFTTTYSSPRDQNIFKAVQDALTATNTSLNHLTEISVNPGPGSFTGIRLGFTIAHTLGLLLNLPVNGKPAGQAQPTYEAS